MTRVAAPVDGQRVARRRSGSRQADHHRRAVRGLAGIDPAATVFVIEVIDGATGANVSMVTAWLAVLAPTLPEASTIRAGR